MVVETLLEERLRQFQPEPLVNHKSKKTQPELESSMITEDENNIDLAKENFLNILNSPEIKKTAENTIRKYGVGTCGPRAFYGTTDVHLELEKTLAEFLGMDESIVYSYGFVAISSSVAAYCKNKDIVFVDKEANFPIQQGLVSARSRVVYFDHNDPKSFAHEAQIIAQDEKCKKLKKFLIIEGVSWKTGKLCPLPEFIEIAEKHKMRIFLDETYSIGVFGKSGKGLTEHYRIDPSRLDMIMGTLESAIGSIGGFCAGSHLTIEHQRLSGSGYIFSASLPTYLAQVVMDSIESWKDKPSKLKQLSEEFDKFLKGFDLEVQSDPQVPFKVFQFKNSEGDKEKAFHAVCKRNGLHFIAKEHCLVINLNVELFSNRKRLEQVYNIFRKAIDEVY